jgi:hypothetical protein
MNRLKLIYASAFAATISIVFSVAITLMAEWIPSLKNALKAWTGHHWTSKSVLSILVYVALLLIAYNITDQPEGSQLRRSIYVVTLAALLGYAILFFFFLSHSL